MDKIIKWIKANPKKALVAAIVVVGGVANSAPAGDVIREALRVLGL